MYRIQINHRRLIAYVLGILIVAGILTLPEKQEPVSQAVTAEPVGQAVKEPVVAPVDETPKEEPAPKEPTIRKKLVLKDANERAEIKAIEIDKIEPQPKELIKGSIEVEITDIQKIDGGVAVFAKAWKDGKPVGFGRDGTVEIERFMIYNPPILVEDPTGDIYEEWTDRVGEVHSRTLKEDPKRAIQEVVADNVRIVGKDGKNIVPGKVGNTTSTFYPNANVETTSVDGQLRMAGGTIQTWGNIRANTTATAVDDSGASREVVGAFGYTTSGNWNELYRAMYLFDTSALPDTDTIDSATMSVYVSAKADPNSEIGMALGTSSPTSNTALATGDFGLGTKFGTTALASDIPWASITASAYNDFALNATGLANVSATGISKFGLMSTNDRDNSSPTWSASVYKHATAYFADQAGTTNDPKLVVVHTSAGGGGATVPANLILFE